MRLGLYHEVADTRYWRDGLWAALQVLGEQHEVVPFQPGDVTLYEGGTYARRMDEVRALPGRKIWFHAGGPPERYPEFEAVVVLADQIAREFERAGVKATVINGTNTDLFRPRVAEKRWDVICPAAFARWKRHELLAEWVREAGTDPARVLCVGHRQEVEPECYELCEAAGFEVRGLVTPEELASLYSQSRECWLAAETVGGSEKALWEARACGLPVRVAPDNPRLSELLAQPVRSHRYYAAKIAELL